MCVQDPLKGSVCRVREDFPHPFFAMDARE